MGCFQWQNSCISQSVEREVVFIQCLLGKLWMCITITTVCDIANKLFLICFLRRHSTTKTWAISRCLLLFVKWWLQSFLTLTLISWVREKNPRKLGPSLIHLCQTKFKLWSMFVKREAGYQEKMGMPFIREERGRNVFLFLFFHFKKPILSALGFKEPFKKKPFWLRI